MSILVVSANAANPNTRKPVATIDIVTALILAQNKYPSRIPSHTVNIPSNIMFIGNFLTADSQQRDINTIIKKMTAIPMNQIIIWVIKNLLTAGTRHIVPDISAVTNTCTAYRTHSEMERWTEWRTAIGVD
eukprot:GHVR01137175.1.p2 GENE.GHVR01137175.1~~GHVR01137175.1.p2  ORF type:complete len:131 (-),score=16.36 GHVR01137175.1:158-550(-)